MEIGHLMLTPSAVFSDAPRGRGDSHTVPPAGTNEQAIIDVLTKRSNVQRQQIAKSFKAQFGKVSRVDAEDRAAAPRMEMCAQGTLH